MAMNLYGMGSQQRQQSPTLLTRPRTIVLSLELLSVVDFGLYFFTIADADDAEQLFYIPVIIRGLQLGSSNGTGRKIVPE